jgi:hypothetical protein
MIALNECSHTLNKSGSRYNDSEVKIIRNFLYKMGELGYEMFQTMKQGNKVIIKRWDCIAVNVHGVMKMIQLYKYLGIEVVCTEQPLNLKNPLYYVKLPAYLYRICEEEE